MSKLLNEWPVVWRRFNPATETWSYHAEELKGLTCEPLYTAPPERTLRDHFAGLAMQTLPKNIPDMETLARLSYTMADAMIAERVKKDD
jgi:hypothetical protein